MTRDDDVMSAPSSPQDSLFDELDDSDDKVHWAAPATARAPPIPGLYVLPYAIPIQMQHQLAENMSQTLWPSNSDQVMMFESPGQATLPKFLTPLLDLLPTLLNTVPNHVKQVIFDSSTPRQVIFNLYRQGQGITPHCDLPTRYKDGIVGISLCGSTVMNFQRDKVHHSLLLRPGDVYVLSGECRWQWTHGIAYRSQDVIHDGDGGQVYTLHRRTRMSITLRRMQPGADIVGA
ncbi:hypothetical protein OIO90_002665 [Microbotryomycetes sp. JL221]|nr:hypothetical protein OIO90_002665 [Microbotryomycetes sp. JL221]